MSTMKRLSPDQILNDPLLNKGTAFTQEERDRLSLHGFLPFHISTMEEQLERRYQNFREKPNDLTKYTYLSNLQNRNEILFYRLVYEHLHEMVPLIYTPTVGDVSVLFSTLYRKNRGIYFSFPLREKIEEIVAQLPAEIDVIVVTDGERVLGLGDVGIGGMAISQGKLALYTLFGGIHPARTLPVMLDVGTNNTQLLKDPLYLGWRHPRITGEAYDQFIDAFVQAINKRFPYVLIQWEDFAKQHARPLLDRYRDKVCSFNDDIQGTAGVVLSAILCAHQLLRQPLKNSKIAILGGGSAGMGIANLIKQAMIAEGAMIQEAAQSVYIVDREGLMIQDKEEVASWNLNQGEKITLKDVVQHARPTVLIGVSGQPDQFSEEIVQMMCSYCERPVILPLSNPTTYSEAKPHDLIHWSKGKALIATGSPFPPVTYQGKTYPIAQCNNVYIFPGVGLGAVIARISSIPDEMFITAAHILSTHSPLAKHKEGSLFPDLTHLRQVSREIAIAVAKQAQAQGLTQHKLDQIEQQVDAYMWFPDYM